jgi:hypothetical protein
MKVGGFDKSNSWKPASSRCLLSRVRINEALLRLAIMSSADSFGSRVIGNINIRDNQRLLAIRLFRALPASMAGWN